MPQVSVIPAKTSPAPTNAETKSSTLSKSSSNSASQSGTEPGAAAPGELRRVLASRHVSMISFGGIIGAVLLFVLFDWGLIVLSSISGASLIVHNIAIQKQVLSLLFVVLVIVGILIQAEMMRWSRAPARR